MIAVLRHRSYRHLFLAQVIALLGTGFTTIALALLAHELAAGNAGLILGAVLAIKMIAYVGIAPVVGAYADRLPRRFLLVTLDVLRAGVVCALPFVTEVWHIFVLIFVLNACSAGFTPIFQATIPDVLPNDEEYTQALSLSRLAYDLENLLSPVAAAALLTILSFNALFLLNAAAFVASAMLVFTVLLPSSQTDSNTHTARSRLTRGVSIYMKTPRLLGLLGLNMAVSVAGAMQIVNTVVYVRSYLGLQQREVALAFASVGAGSMVVALILPKVLKMYRERTVMLLGGSLITGTLLLGSVLNVGYAGLLGLWFVLGVGSSLVMTPTGRLLKQSCHPEDRTALFAAQFSLSHACWFLAYLLAGWMGANIGLGGTFVVLGAIALISTAVAARYWWSQDPYEIEHEHAEMEHSHVHTHDEHHQHDHESWEGPEPHRHAHVHLRQKHKHAFVIDQHHPLWPE